MGTKTQTEGLSQRLSREFAEAKAVFDHARSLSPSFGNRAAAPPSIANAVITRANHLRVSTEAAPKVAEPFVQSVADLGAILKLARKRMKMSQQVFADYAGVGRRFVSELENGKESLEIGKVLACARSAGVDIRAKPRFGP